MEKVQLAITVLGGLAIFVYGMGLMSEGLTQIAGARLKAVLGYITRNRFMAILAGAGITAIIQSSSATTVMTVGFTGLTPGEHRSSRCLQGSPMFRPEGRHGT